MLQFVVDIDGTFQVRQVRLEPGESQALLVDKDIQDFPVLVDQREFPVLAVQWDRQEEEALLDILDLLAGLVSVVKVSLL